MHMWLQCMWSIIHKVAISYDIQWLSLWMIISPYLRYKMLRSTINRRKDNAMLNSREVRCNQWHMKYFIIIPISNIQISSPQQLHSHMDIIANSMLKQIVFVTLSHQVTIKYNYPMCVCMYQYPISIPVRIKEIMNIFFGVYQTIYCTGWICRL